MDKPELGLDLLIEACEAQIAKGKEIITGQWAQSEGGFSLDPYHVRDRDMVIHCMCPEVAAVCHLTDADTMLGIMQHPLVHPFAYFASGEPRHSNLQVHVFIPAVLTMLTNTATDAERKRWTATFWTAYDQAARAMRDIKGCTESIAYYEAEGDAGAALYHFTTKRSTARRLLSRYRNGTPVKQAAVALAARYAQPDA